MKLALLICLLAFISCKKDIMTIIKCLYESPKRKELITDVITAIVTKDFTINKNIEIRETLSNILPENTNVIDYSVDINSISPMVNSNSSISIEGSAKVNVITQNTENNELDTKQVDVLVNADVELANVTSDAKITVDIQNNGINLTQNGRDIEIDMNIMVKS